MDGVSAASSAFAIVSLAMQIGGGVQKLWDFWSSIKDGPKEIYRITKDLDVISNILDNMRQDAGNERPHSQALTANLAALDGCSSALEDLLAIIDELQPGFSSQKRRIRKWTAFKSAWKRDKIQKFQEILRDMKITLILAKDNSADGAATFCSKRYQKDLEDISRGVQLLLKKQSPETIIATATDSLKIEQHINTLREATRKTSETIANPISRLAFERLIDSAFSQISEGINKGSSVAGDDWTLRKTTQFAETETRLPTPYCTQHHTVKKYRFTLSTLFGTLHLTSEMLNHTASACIASMDLETDIDKDKQDTQCTIQSTVSVHPSGWLLKYWMSYGIQILLKRSIQGFEGRLKTYRAVPDNAPIFEFCEKGDTTSVQKLFKERRASPWDTNSSGITPLYFAARAGKPDTCRLLISQGADLDARSRSDDIIASYCCLRERNKIDQRQCATHIETLRLFLEQLEFSDDINCSGLVGLRRLISTAKCSGQLCSHPPDYPAAFYWALPLLKQQISINLPSMAYGLALLFRQAMLSDDVKLLTRLVPLATDVNSKQIIKWFSPAHEIAIGMRETGICSTARYLVTHGLDFHVVADDEFSGSSQYPSCANETPTSFVLRYSYSFFLFRKLLRDSNINITDFIDNEVKQSPILKAGWTKRTLAYIFELDYIPLKTPLIRCGVCYGYGVTVETWWLAALQRLISTTGISSNVAHVFNADDQMILRQRDMEATVCYYCQMKVNLNFN